MPELPNEGQKPSQIASSAAGSLPEVHSLKPAIPSTRRRGAASRGSAPIWHRIKWRIN